MNVLNHEFQQFMSKVEAVIVLNQLSSPKIEARLFGTLCQNCSEPYEMHGTFTDGCPNFRTKFKEQRCEAPIPLSADGCHAVECGKKCVAGSNLCANHFEE
jgi:hypothetical protein